MRRWMERTSRPTTGRPVGPPQAPPPPPPPRRERNPIEGSRFSRRQIDRRMTHRLIVLHDVVVDGERLIRAGDVVTLEHARLTMKGADIWASVDFTRPTGLRGLVRRLILRTLG